MNLNWTVRLGDVAAIERRGVTAGEIADGTRYVGLEHISAGGETLDYAEVAAGELASNKFKFDEGHVLYGKLRPYLAKIVTPDFAGVCSTDILPIRPGPAIDKHFLLHYLRLPENVAWAAGRATGVNLPRLSPSELAELTIPLPPLDEQRRIAAILDKADALRQKRKRAIALLDSLTQSIFMEMFGDPKLNPKKLPMTTLGDLLKVKSGDGLTSAQMDPGGEFTVYGGNGPNGLHSKYMFEEPQIVIGRVGVYCGAVHITKPKSWVTDNALYVSNVRSETNQIYLAWALRLADLNQLAGRVAQPLISGGRIYPVEILLPAIQDQNDFSEAIKSVCKVSGMLDESPIESLFSSLQNRAFSGQL